MVLTDGNLLIMSSNPRRHDGGAGLSLSCMRHPAVDDAMDAVLSAKAAALGKHVPRNLSHSIVFFTAGRPSAASLRLAVPLADATGAWSRGMGFKRSRRGYRS